MRQLSVSSGVRKTVGGLAFLAGMFGSAAAQEQASASQPLVYVVDMQKIVNESIVGKSARSDIEAEAKKREAALEGPRIELEKMRQDIQKQASLLSASALEERREQLQKREKDFAAKVQDQREELSRKRDQEMLNVVKEINTVISDLAKGGKYPFIIERDPRVVVYVADRLDISGEVIKQLNEKKIGL